MEYPLDQNNSGLELFISQIIKKYIRLSPTAKSPVFRKNLELPRYLQCRNLVETTQPARHYLKWHPPIGIMRKQHMQAKNNPPKFIQSPQFIVYHHEGKDSFSIQSDFHDNFPISLIMVDRGENIMVASKNILPQTLQANRMQIFFDPKTAFNFSYTGSKKWAFFEVKLSHSILKELPTHASGLWSSFVAKIKQARAAILSEWNLAYKSDLQLANHQLFAEQFADADLQSKYQHLKLREILLYLLHECLQPVTENKQITLKERDLVAKTQKLLNKSVSGNEFTIISIAEDLGTNETTLKQAFKKITGTSIYQFFLTKRMNRAKTLLQDGMSVSKVSYTMGYSNVSHFSYRFKKTFGLTPEQVKTRI